MAASLLLLLFPPACLLAALAFLAQPRAARIPLEGRHVFISGGSNGIGLAMATAAAREGARVSILARDAARLEEARAAIQRGSGRDDVVGVGVHVADVRDADAVARALREVGPVDVLVCNHGVLASRELVDQDVEEMRRMVDTNLMGTLHLVKAALPAMKARACETGLPASIAIMSSQAGQVGIYGYAAYSASKFALRGLGEALQHEVAMDNVRVSLIFIFPPDTETPGLQKELNKRSELTNIIAASSSGMNANGVAKKALDGIKSGKFVVPCNFEGALLAIATAGLSLQSCPLVAFLGVTCIGLMRFVALCFQWKWFSNIESYYIENKKRE